MPEGHWDGRTYYSRSQLKPAPFNNTLVGSYVFLAGLSGASQLLGTLLEMRRGSTGVPAVRRGRYLAMLAPTIGALCLVLDLKTPQRFYNMLRVFKPTSPMSFGSWALVGFGATSGMTAALQWMSDRVRRPGLLRGLARITQIPAASLGSMLAVYTASLFSATSTPHWAAGPVRLAIRFGAASVASAASGMSLGEKRCGPVGRSLDEVAIAALAIELAATLGSDETDPASQGTNAMAITAPLALFMLSLLLPGQRSRLLSSAASLGVLVSSLAMRIDMLNRGYQSARRPEVSMRFAQPDSVRLGPGSNVPSP